MSTRSAIPFLPTNATYEDIVKHYVLYRRASIHEELKHFAEQPSLDLAINQSVLAVDKHGKRLRHQRRLHKTVIPKSLTLIIEKKVLIARSSNFDELYSEVEAVLRKVPRAGKLYCYDTSLRIGCYLGLYPTKVFLQTGAYDGARKISKEFRDRTIPLSKFPEAFHVLAPFEMENLLCIYKSNLQPL